MTTKWLAFLAVLLCAAPALAQFRLANIYGDQMVLQMAPKSTQIWGFGTAGTSVSVSVKAQQVSTTVNAGGTWSVRLAPENAGGPFTLTATHNTDSVSINVWFGDVWVCSGQSNMEMPISQMVDPTGETNKAVSYTNIRIMQVTNTFATTEQDELSGITTPWSATTSQNVPGFSALCLMFGERLSDSLGNSRPIGLIDATWGGTRIESWVSTRVTLFCNTPPDNSANQNGDHNLWNAMIKPLTNFAVRGAIWYQGESNTGYNQDYYACHIQRIVQDWKDTFIDGKVPVPNESDLKFPFGIVQIGPFSGGGDSAYGILRLHQTVEQGVLPNSYVPEGFTAATYDTTDPSSPTGDIHPRDKPTVADRLANAAKKLLYRESWSLYGPVPLGILFGTGTATITYDRNIVVSGATGFSALVGSSWVDATITGSTANSVTVSMDPTATKLAYAWKGVVCDYKACSIYSNDSEALPAQVWRWDVV